MHWTKECHTPLNRTTCRSCWFEEIVWRGVPWESFVFQQEGSPHVSTSVVSTFAPWFIDTWRSRPCSRFVGVVGWVTPWSCLSGKNTNPWEKEGRRKEGKGTQGYSSNHRVSPYGHNVCDSSQSWLPSDCQMGVSSRCQYPLCKVWHSLYKIPFMVLVIISMLVTPPSHWMTLSSVVFRIPVQYVMSHHDISPSLEVYVRTNLKPECSDVCHHANFYVWTSECDCLLLTMFSMCAEFREKTSWWYDSVDVGMYDT